jgi:hypothetical protein
MQIGMELTRNGWSGGKLWWQNSDWEGVGADTRKLKYDGEEVMWHKR